MATGNLLDLLLGMNIQADGDELEPLYAALNFASGLTVEVDTENERYTMNAAPAASLRVIDEGPATLTAADTLVLVTVSEGGEPTYVTLAAPAIGPPVIIFIVGTTPVSLRRPTPGSQMINGVASHFSAGAGDRVMVISDGANYYTWSGLE